MVVVPASAVQASQAGNCVYVVENGIAAVRPVEVNRTTGPEMVTVPAHTCAAIVSSFSA
jgi:multidrug efflux pump subunit AcrA (membrane-fusion protein)